MLPLQSSRFTKLSYCKRSSLAEARRKCIVSMTFSVAYSDLISKVAFLFVLDMVETFTSVAYAFDRLVLKFGTSR